MTKQTTGHDETDNRHGETAGRDGPPVIAGCDRQSHKSNRHPRPVQQSSTTYPSVIPGLYSSHPRPDRGSPRLRSRAGPEMKAAKSMSNQSRKAGFHTTLIINYSLTQRTDKQLARWVPSFNGYTQQLLEKASWYAW